MVWYGTVEVCEGASGREVAPKIYYLMYEI